MTECEEIAAASKMDKGATNKEEGTLKFAGKKRWLVGLDDLLAGVGEESGELMFKRQKRK